MHQRVEDCFRCKIIEVPASLVWSSNFDGDGDRFIEERQRCLLLECVPAFVHPISVFLRSVDPSPVRSPKLIGRWRKRKYDDRSHVIFRSRTDWMSRAVTRASVAFVIFAMLATPGCRSPEHQYKTATGLTPISLANLAWVSFLLFK